MIVYEFKWIGNFMQKIKMVFILCLFMCFVVQINAAEYNLKINLSDSLRPVTHCASGSLYGMTESLPSDINAHVTPLKPNVFVQPAVSGTGHQQPIGDAFEVAKRLQGTSGKVQIRLADILPGWPYQWPGSESWLQSVKGIIEKKLSSGLTNFDGYEIWNEPYGTWKDANGSFHSTLWKPTYDLIKSLDPEAKIIGPSFSYYNSTRMSAFLTYAKENNCLPDVISWHQWGSGGFIASLENYRSLEKTLGISERAISINEYSSDTHVYEGAPGISVPFIAKFERNGVESAMISWWFTNLPGRLGSLLTAKNEKGGGWWLYKWYADMSGYMANTLPPNDKSDNVDAFAAVDESERYASIVLGENSIGTTNVNIESIPDFFGDEVNVLIEYVTWVDKDSAVNVTQTISSETYAISNHTLSIPVNITNQFYAYRLYITPTKQIPQEPYKSLLQIPGTIEAENYDIGGQNNAYYDNNSENKGGLYRNDGVDIVAIDSADTSKGFAVGYTEANEWLEYSVDIKESKAYSFKARIASGADSSGFRLFIDDVAITDTIFFTSTGDWDTYAEIEKITDELTLGTHVLKILIIGSYVNIDNLVFYEKTNHFVHNKFTPDISTQKYSVYNIRGTFLGSFDATDMSSLKNKMNKSKLNSGVYLVRAKKNHLNQLIELKKE